MNIWNQAPFVRLLLPFLTGIICAVYLPFQSEYISYFALLLLAILSITVLVPRLNFSYKKTWVFGLLLNTLLFLLAYQLTIVNTEKFDSKHYTHYSTNGPQYAYIRIAEPFQEKEKSIKVVGEIKRIKHNGSWLNTNGKAMMYFKKDSLALQINYGDELIIHTAFKPVPPPQNPGEFNYRRFLSFHNVYEQAYINSGNWHQSGTNSSNPLLKYCIDLRNALLDVLRKNHIAGDEFAVGSALLLGFEDKLDADIISAYSSTGALHVLSVSGLHVAIVYLIFSWLLFFLDKVKHGNIIKAAVLIILLWLYSALTGLSPSVLRAATMFSFIIIGKAYSRYTNIYNTLAASAFLLLTFDPYLIMQVGFQLSYLAVIGIVYIQRKIYAWFDFNNWLLDQVWTITSVSIAAQIATFPLGLHYFHQFPNYFLLSNLLVIPVSTAIVYLGVALFAFAKLSFIAGYLGLLFGWCVWFLNQSVIIIEKWPYALLQGISISVFETWLLYGVIILFLYYFIQRRFQYLVIALLVCIVILFSQLIEQHQQNKQKKFIVYNVPKTSAIDFINAKSNVLLTDTAFAKNESRLLFHVRHNWWDLGLNNTKIISDSIRTDNLYISKNFIQFHTKKILHINEAIQATAGSVPVVPVDYLVISENTNLKITDLINCYHPRIIVFDSSNSDYKIKKWKEDCSRYQQNFHAVTESGAFVADI